MSETTHEQKLTLVIGGTGKTGRRVAEGLTARNVPVRIGSRSAQPPFDWEDEATWADAVRDVAQAYVTYYPDLAFAGAADRIRSFVELAVASGVQRLVLLSGRNEPEAQRAEQIVQSSGAEWTIVRSSFFAQNFSEHFLLDPILAGEVAFPAGNTAEPLIDADDVADIAIEALSGDRHVGQLYEVTGPRLLTFEEAVDEIAKATGRDIRYVPISLDEYAAGLTEAGLPADYVTELTALFAEILDGRSAYLSDGVQRALSRPPREFTDYVRNAAATGVWSANDDGDVR
ncbi:MAG: NmrA family NAD(P)-binding protein [Acidimicrobiales bacterium]